MKQIFFLIAIAGLTQFSCTKSLSGPSTPTSLDGKWRMIIVKENISGSSTTKPSSIQGNVDITFTFISSANGTFIGNTPTNQIEQNDFTVGENQSLTIVNLNMTKLWETIWGQEFVGNIREAQNYSFENNSNLDIRTTNKTLIFQKQ